MFADLQQYFIANPWITIALGLWTIPWKGVALWKSAQKGHKAWFVVILIINTLAVLEILYIFVFSKKKIQLKKILELRHFAKK